MLYYLYVRRVQWQGGGAAGIEFHPLSSKMIQRYFLVD